jgi:hypothetical protein
MMVYVTVEELNQKRLEFLQKKAHTKAATDALRAAGTVKQDAYAAFDVANKKEDKCLKELKSLEDEIKCLAYRYMSEQRPEESIQMTMPVVNVSDDIPF